MPTVRIDQQRIWVDAESRPLLHGEMHYWRLSQARWSNILDAVREIGLDMVSSYVCWEFHELSPGQFDFSSLRGFIELVASKGMWLILRPGPYIYAEWRNSGVPDRVVQYHRAHPLFRAAAEEYMAAVVSVLKPYLATVGGPVVMVQADNEADPWADSYAAQLPLAQQTDMLDVVRFYHQYTADIVRWTADTYRRLGIDVPIYTNTYSGFGVQHWPMLAQSVDLVGPDVYPTAELRSEPLEHRRMLERIRFSRTCAPLAYIPEFEAGIWHGWHERVGVLGANHYRLICMSALLAGAAGWGWYMLVNRDNWYMSPIDELGRARPDLAGEFSEIVRVFREIDPPNLSKVTDTAVAMDVLQLAARVHGPPGETLLEALYAADIDYECFDVDTGRIDKPLLFAHWLSRQLEGYAERGGTLVLFDSDVTGVVRIHEAQPLAVELGDRRVICNSSVLGWYAGVPGEPIVAQRLAEPGRTQQGTDLHIQQSIGERFVVGYRQGNVVRLGLQPSPELLLGLHDWLGFDVASQASAPDVKSALFNASSGARYMVVVNNGEVERTARIRLAQRAERVRDLFGGETDVIGNDVIVSLARKSGTVVRLD